MTDYERLKWLLEHPSEALPPDQLEVRMPHDYVVPAAYVDRLIDAARAPNPYVGRYGSGPWPKLSRRRRLELRIAAARERLGELVAGRRFDDGEDW